MFANHRSIACVSYRLARCCGGSLLAQSEACWRPSSFAAIASSSSWWWISGARSFGKKNKIVKKQPVAHIRQKLEARLAAAEQEPYGERRGHKQLVEYLKHQAMDHSNVEGYLRTYLFARHATRHNCRKLRELSPKKLAASFLGEPCNQKMAQGHGRRIILELWYHGKSPLLEEYQIRHDDWIVRNRLKLDGEATTTTTVSDATEKPIVADDNSPTPGSAKEDKDDNDEKDKSMDDEAEKTKKAPKYEYTLRLDD